MKLTSKEPREDRLPTFASLKIRNYRRYFFGAMISNTGTWMQRIAQDWLVLTALTHNNATAVGIITALQFGPTFLLLPLTGAAADRCDKRKLLIATQCIQGVLALGLGLFTLAGIVQLWHVYLFAFLLGCATAFDSPARHTFVAELVGDADLSNAVALNSTSFNAARMIGPAVAGVLIAAIGTGWVFLINAASFAAVISSLFFLRLDELHRSRRPARKNGGQAEGVRYVMRRPDILIIFVMLFLVSTFGLNFQIFIAAMAVSVFHSGADEYGLLTSAMAVGTVSGALLAARRAYPKFSSLIAGAALLGLGSTVAALMPSSGLFALALAGAGVAAQTFTTTANSMVQLSTDPTMRGRVMALYLAIFLGCAPIGGPAIGWISDVFGPRWAMGTGAFASLAAAAAGCWYLAKYRHLRVRFDRGRLCIRIDAAAPFAKERRPVE